MDSIIKEASVKLLTSLKNTLEKGNLYNSSEPGARLTGISATLDSKMGVLIGEIIESSFLQLYDETTRFEIDGEGYAREARDLIPFVDALVDAIKTDDDNRIYSALLEFRFHVTKRQYGMSNDYKHRRPARFR